MTLTEPMLDHERIHSFVRELESQARRLETAVSGGGPDAVPLVREAIQEIDEAVEELQVSEEELRVTTESLALSQAQLEVERARYVDLFQSAPDAYLVTDPAGTIREANRAAAALLGVAAGHLAGKPLPVYVEEADRRRLRRFLLRAVDGGSAEGLELTLVPRHGDPVPVAMRVSPLLSLRGEVTELRIILRSLADRRRLDEQARQLEAERQARWEAENANRIKTDFVSTLSHEVRTPLTSIMAYTEMLAMGLFSPLAPEAQKAVGHIDEASRHLLILIEEMLDFARVEASQEVLHPQRVRVAEVVQDVVDFIGPLAAKQRLQLHSSAGSPVELTTDRAKLRQILINLASNAIKFTPAGEVRIEVEVLDGWVHLHVQDTGTGISAEDAERVFDPFWQAGKRNGRSTSGAGLGLAISRRYAELLGGELTVSSIPEVGSCFTLRLPLASRLDAGEGAGG